MKGPGVVAIVSAPFLAPYAAAAVTYVAYKIGEVFLPERLLLVNERIIILIFIVGGLLCYCIGPLLIWRLSRKNRPLIYYILWGMFFSLFFAWRLPLLIVGLPYGALLGFFTWMFLGMLKAPRSDSDPSSESGPAGPQSS